MFFSGGGVWRGEWVEWVVAEVVAVQSETSVTRAAHIVVAKCFRLV